ncbi:hypothetical protein [Serratia oryzae]|uniref:DUF1475 domain-containing protein n=1 Tax=Serratia oryzae TaxID=2034155 RepID=A0A1S8CDT3_9GAMM|nr:hypothetical protein [Serratia oryzae]OMQ18216.1 hypothetical protein BMI79_21955 [Serratia oryzae]
MVLLRLWLFLVIVVLSIYTVIVGQGDGWNLLPIFFKDIMNVGWPGQFNLDFLFMLTLSALWTAWRNRFSAAGLVLGSLALFGGSLFLSVYLLVLTVKHRGDMNAVLIGK